MSMGLQWLAQIRKPSQHLKKMTNKTNNKDV